MARRPNPVADALAKLGGPTQACVRTGASPNTWMRWRRKGYIDDARILLDVAALTGLDPDMLARPKRDVA